MNKKNTLMKGDAEFMVNGKKIKFSIIHDMPETKGLSFSDALTNWVYRTNEYTAESFVEYVNSKHTGFVCMTEDEYNNLK
jgi:hypothetical protein